MVISFLLVDSIIKLTSKSKSVMITTRLKGGVQTFHKLLTFLSCFIVVNPRGEGTPYNGQYGEAPPERGTFFNLGFRYIKG